MSETLPVHNSLHLRNPVSLCGLRHPLREITRVVALTLVVTLSANATATATAPSASHIADIKAKIEKRGAGNKVKIVRSDGVVVVGKIETIGIDSFRLVPHKSITPMEIAFGEVSAVHGPGLSTGAKVGIGVVAGVGIAVAIIAIIYKRSGIFNNVKF